MYARRFIFAISVLCLGAWRQALAQTTNSIDGFQFVDNSGNIRGHPMFGIPGHRWVHFKCSTRRETRCISLGHLLVRRSLPSHRKIPGWQRPRKGSFRK